MSRDQELLPAIARVLARDASASMDRIASAVGVSRATLHRRYPSRNDLVHALSDQALDRTEAAVEMSRLDEGPAREALIRLVTGLLPLADLYWFLVCEPSLIGVDEDRWERVETQVSELFLRGQESGEFRVDLPAPWLTTAAETVLGAASDAVNRGVIASADQERLVLISILTLAERKN